MNKLEQLFGSKTRVKLLSLLLLNPERAFFVREITRRLNKRINSVRRELEILTRIGLLKKKLEGRKTFYQANKKFIFFEELSSIVEKSGKPGDKISDAVKSLGDISFACLSGFFTSNFSTKVDFLIVGNIQKEKLKRFIKKLEKDAGKEINFTAFTDTEFSYRQKCKDKFLLDILSNNSVIIDNINE